MWTILKLFIIYKSFIIYLEVIYYRSLFYHLLMSQFHHAIEEWSTNGQPCAKLKSNPMKTVSKQVYEKNPIAQSAEAKLDDVIIN